MMLIGAVALLSPLASLAPSRPSSISTTRGESACAYRDMGKKEESESELKLAEELRSRPDSHPWILPETLDYSRLFAASRLDFNVDVHQG